MSAFEGIIKNWSSEYGVTERAVVDIVKVRMGYVVAVLLCDDYV